MAVIIVAPIALLAAILFLGCPRWSDHPAITPGVLPPIGACE